MGLLFILLQAEAPRGESLADIITAVGVVIGVLLTGITGLLTAIGNRKIDNVGKTVDGKMTELLAVSKVANTLTGEKTGRLEATKVAEETANRVVERSNEILEKVGDKVTPIIDDAAKKVADTIIEKINKPDPPAT